MREIGWLVSGTVSSSIPSPSQIIHIININHPSSKTGLPCHFVPYMPLISWHLFHAVFLFILVSVVPRPICLPPPLSLKTCKFSRKCHFFLYPFLPNARKWAQMSKKTKGGKLYANQEMQKSRNKNFGCWEWDQYIPGWVPNPLI